MISRIHLCLVLFAAVGMPGAAAAQEGLPTLTFPAELWSAPPFELPREWGLLIRGQQGEAEEEDTIETDRPDFTEASSTVPQGMVQLEMGYTFIYDDDEVGGVRANTHSGPETLLRVGLTELVELRLFWNYLWETTVEGGATTTNDGAEDFTVGTKVFLLEQEQAIPEASVIFELSTPTGADAFSNRHVEFGLNLLYGWDLPEDFSLGASTGYSTGTDVTAAVVAGAPEIEDRHSVFHQSVALGVPLAERLGGYVEYFGLYYHGLAGSGPEHYIDGGFTYLLTNDLQLDIRAGHGLSDDADDFFGGAGLSVRQ